MNHLCERHSRALGLSLAREESTVLVAGHFQQQQEDLPGGASFTWTHGYAPACVLSLLVYSREARQTDRGFQPKGSFPLILLFQDHQEDPTASGSLFQGIESRI